MNTKSKRKHTRLPHLSIASIVLVIVALAVLLYYLQLNVQGNAAGEAIQLPKVYVPPPSNQQIISAEALKLSGVVLQSDFEIKVKEVVKNSLSFRNSESGFSCQQICQRAPSVVGNLYGVKFTSQCVAVINSGFAATAEKVILASADKTYYTNGFIASCEKPIAVTEEGSSLCLCI
jgi:hypothetical protein